MAKINAGSLKVLLITVIFGVIFFAMAPVLVYTLSTGIDTFLQMIVGNSTLFGSSTTAVATVVKNNWGMFLVIGALLMVISIATGLFSRGRR